MTGINEWLVIWETDDGPSVDGIFASEAMAFDAAFEDWCAFEGGVVGGYDDDPPEELRERFEDIYASSDRIWIVRLQRHV